MALAHWDIETNEDQLRLQSYTTWWGTRARDAVDCIQSFGLFAEVVRDATLNDLRQWLKQDVITILLIDLQPLHHEIGRHAIIVESLSETQVQYLDPLSGRHTSTLDLLDHAWRLNYRRAILIRST
jgi:ABC-type bacteriocin/lantibiotic exporter with double-glycine peptidase domain